MPNDYVINNVIRVAILTKSSKYGDYCVAGINMDTGRWVRIVSDNEETHGAVSEADMMYANRTCCKTMDIASVPIKEPCPEPYQPENVLMDMTRTWAKLGEITVPELRKLHAPENQTVLLGNRYPYITAEKIAIVGHSLVLAEVDNFTITRQEAHSTKAAFSYHGDLYKDISVTDPDYYTYPQGTQIGRALIVLSLPGVPFQERKYYKFVAKIIPVNPVSSAPAEETELFDVPF